MESAKSTIIEGCAKFTKVHKSYLHETGKISGIPRFISAHFVYLSESHCILDFAVNNPL
jgi:hypothetical protein